MSANGLAAGDTNGITDIFVKNLRSGAIVRANTTSAGAQMSSTPSCNAMTADGWPEDVHAELWGSWHGREAEYYRACAKAASDGRAELESTLAAWTIRQPLGFDQAYFDSLPERLRAQMRKDGVVPGVPLRLSAAKLSTIAVVSVVPPLMSIVLAPCATSP